ncbi:glycine reductase [Caloranaerobacter sp. TR13]|uniref:glycine/sarcosine/betaine reductase complex component C subunit beta n=1 Tax=Caloranaerobacter sp. TR13 TaxID=1302151 RepID=UPI0006D3E494|nr:glycine/sarcosine/betaine reductase complex component C subunit beta [Caloranaerobacter sp. TR13]KPU27066.1 glycine reductase [Caloranaerobacter sp. TR13]
MSFAVVKGTGYVLVHAPDMVIHSGTTQTSERLINPDSEYLKELPKHLRNFDEVVSYAPNQTYIGNITPDDLSKYEMPWYDKKVEDANRFGKFGEIMPQDEFIGLMKISDAFDLVKLEKEFTNVVKEKLEKHPLINDNLISKLKEGEENSEIEKLINEQHAEPIYNEGKIVGCVKRAHDIDINLNAHTLFENLVVKASGVLALLNLLDKSNFKAEDIDYVIECSEEACGDMNQRGGGNFAKAIAEVAGCINATGSDTRGFCAAPTHALIEAAALVQAGVYENVVIVGGGATAKLGMNGKDHVKKGMPVLEDVLGGFAILVSKNDGVNPVLRTDLVGRHTVGTGSSPQAVITSLITAPLDKGNLKITDIDKYSVEMQNPDVTKPAGAGDVPTSNYKMIAALGVKRKELERKDLMNFVKEHGMPGWAPTQGHIPSGVPYVGFAREELLDGNINRVMIVGKGSLFLGRMTNLFDGVSIVIERNSGKVDSDKGVSEEEVKKLVAEAMREFASHLLRD